MDGARCGRCGNNTIVNGGCAACGAGVKQTGRWWRRSRKTPKPHEHAYVYVKDPIFEAMEKQRKEQCEGCKAVRVQDL